MSDCIFCQIVAGKLPVDKVYEDEHILAFHDIAPKAPVHVLVIPKQHVASLAEISEADRDWVAHLALTLPKIAEKCGLHQGFRTIVNTGPGGGQEVFHLHYHILGGEQLPGF